MIQWIRKNKTAMILITIGSFGMHHLVTNEYPTAIKYPGLIITAIMWGYGIVIPEKEVHNVPIP